MGEKKNGTSGKFCNLADDRYSRVSIAWKTAVEKNLFDVVLSNVEEQGGTPYIFFAETREKNTLNPISRRAVSDITPKAARISFFMRNTALDNDSMSDSVRFT